MRGRTQIILLSKAWEKHTKPVLDSEAKIILKSVKDHQKDITRFSFKYLPVVIVVHKNARLESSNRILQPVTLALTTTSAAYARHITFGALKLAYMRHKCYA